MAIVVDTSKTPSGRAFLKRKRRKRTKRKDRKTTASVYQKSVPLPLGKSYKFHTRYVDKNVVIDPTAGGVPATHVFSLNGLYDPDITGVGHQPIGFDELMVMYDHYCVIGARVRITFSNTSNQYQQLCIAQIKDTATTSTESNEIIENGNCKYTTLGALSGGQGNREIVIKASPSKFFGRNVMEGDKYQGTVSSNPADQLYLHLQCGPLTAVDAGPVYATVDIEYIAMLTEPKQFNQS